MARKGVTYEQVVEAAKAIEAEGENPTIQRVLQRLGTGSPNTIHRHLRSWKEQSAPQKPAALKLLKSYRTHSWRKSAARPTKHELNLRLKPRKP